LPARKIHLSFLSLKKQTSFDPLSLCILLRAE
jgi:hypothetical protein